MSQLSCFMQCISLKIHFKETHSEVTYALIIAQVVHGSEQSPEYEYFVSLEISIYVLL